MTTKLSTPQNEDALDGATDRFAQFFLEPLFTEGATEREINAIHSEHSKNVQSDAWRLLQISRNMAHPEHPLHGFSTGNLETLLEKPKEQNLDLRQALLDFHSKYYSSNIMTLAVLGEESVDDLEKMVREKFQNITNKHVEMPRGAELAKDKPPAYPKTEIRKKQMYVVPVKDTKQLSFQFQVPDNLISILSRL